MATNSAAFEEKRSKVFINTISIIVPLVVAVLLGIQNKIELGSWTRSLPHIIGAINSLTTFTLILGLVFIKSKKIEAHRRMMTISVALGAIFLVCYVIYHLTNPSKPFQGEGFIRYVYYFTLVSHVGLSLVVLPLVLRALFYALTGQFENHRRIVRFAYPIWLYVSITGVIVYLFVYQLFPAK